MRPGDERGFFLIIVVAVIAALAAILVQFGVDAQLSALSSGNYRDEVVARQGGQSVLAAIKIAILRGQWQQPKLVAFIASKLPEEIHCTGWVTDEEGKLPVNQLVAAGPEGEAILRRYWEERGCTLQSLNALIDWIDPDDRTIQGGSELAYYGGLGAIPPNRPLQSIFELPVIPFMKRDLKRLHAAKEAPLSKDLTAWGLGKVNLLTADRDVMMALSGALTPEEMDRIMAERLLGRIQTLEDFRTVVHLPPRVLADFWRWGTLDSTAFRVHVETTYRHIHVVLRAVLWRRGNRIKTIYFREGLWQPA